MLQIGARYEGYASTIGRPVLFGNVDEEYVRALEAGYAAHDIICRELYDGNNAGNVAKADFSHMESAGFRDWLLYGPCHGTGLMEGEPPWIESNSDYLLKENMTYCVDIFMGNHHTGRGFRVEDSVRVGTICAENMTDFPKKIFRK